MTEKDRAGNIGGVWQGGVLPQKKKGRGARVWTPDDKRKSGERKRTERGETKSYWGGEKVYVLYSSLVGG